jgi:hypothetical protein
MGELRCWWSGSVDGIGLVMGTVSGGLETLDFDTTEKL